jgi:two-component system response regulator MprA
MVELCSPGQSVLVLCLRTENLVQRLRMPEYRMATTSRVLIVDDDETVLRTFAKALTLEGYDVRVAASPLTGLQELEATPPDAILLDLRMPFVNGIGFLYRLRAHAAHRHTPVAIITGDPCIDDPAMNELRDLEAEVVFKPLWLEDVVSVTKNLLEKRRQTS